MLHPLYTVGYSSFFNPDALLAALKQNKIDAVVDVRGYPDIASFEHYKGSNLQKVLHAHGIHYLAFSKEFGVRPVEDAYYTDNAVDFDKIMASQQFQQGCKRIRKGLEKYAICLLCAEKDPATCHRAILLTHQLEKLHPEITIRHILADGLLTQRDIDNELKKRYALLNGSLDTCYKLQGKSIAWRRKER